MALITCPDCGRNVSDMALACPDCARPIASLEGRVLQREVGRSVGGTSVGNAARPPRLLHVAPRPGKPAEGALALTHPDLVLDKQQLPESVVCARCNEPVLLGYAPTRGVGGYICSECDERDAVAAMKRRVLILRVAVGIALFLALVGVTSFLWSVLEPKHDPVMRWTD